MTPPVALVQSRRQLQGCGGVVVVVVGWCHFRLTTLPGINTPHPYQIQQVVTSTIWTNTHGMVILLGVAILFRFSDLKGGFFALNLTFIVLKSADNKT